MSKSIAEWLDDAGFGKYADAFKSHDIGFDILDALTEDHLKEIGLSLGDRLRLLRVIGRKDEKNKQTVLAAPAATPVPTPSSEDISRSDNRQSDAERRPLTVMFCDLADSTALSTKLDPEDLQDVIRAYQDASTECVRNYEGFVAKYMGDGILVYFGYPKALERNGERAVHSALEIVEAMTSLNQTLGKDKGIEIAVRVGISTGTVMVGEVVGKGMAQERTVIGEAPNMAARLQGLAGRNGIVVGSLTKEISGDLFTYEDMGIHQLKGISEPAQAWSVTGVREDSEKASADDHDAITRPALVGRDEEIGLLGRAWQSTKGEGRGQVVTLSGEAGIGKSSLIDGLKGQVRTDGWPFLTMRCSPYHTNSALYPVVEHFKRLARWQPDDSEAIRFDKIERMLDRYIQPNSETVPLMAAFLSVPVPEDRYPPPTLSPQQQKQQTQDVIVGITMEVAERGAFLHMWEDLHWADPSTLELIGLLIDQAPTAGLMMVLTSRPEFAPPWPMRSHITPITLNRLERTHAAALVARLVGEKPLPNEVVDHIITKTDGVPLYVEELTKTILGSDILRDSGNRFELTGPLASLAIPDTLQESLMARLDRLPNVREIAQLGSVLGREFAYEMISGLSTSGDSILQDSLGQLVEAELLYQRGRPPQAKYIFKHALVQDAAYASLLRRTRQHHHQHVAELLEAKFPDIVENQPELIARHYFEAGLNHRAIDYLQKAGERSLFRSANEEAIAHLGKGLEIISGMPESPELDQRELNMLLMSVAALVAVRGYAAPEVEVAHRRALELCRKLGDIDKEFSVMLGQILYHFLQSEMLLAREVAEQAVSLAGNCQNTGFDLAAQRPLGLVACFQGELEYSVTCFDKVVAGYDIDIHGVSAFHRSGSDFGVAALATSGFALLPLGYADQAMHRTEEGMALSYKLDHPVSVVYATWVASLVLRERGESEAALEQIAACSAIAEDKGFPQYIAWVTSMRGGVLLDQGNVVEAIEESRRGIDLNLAIGTRLFSPYWYSILAEALGRNGQLDEGMTLLEEAFDHVGCTGEHWGESALYRVKGKLLLAGDNVDQVQAAACFAKAMEIAQLQKARTWELRAAADLARLWQEQGEKEKALKLLSPVYGWFTEGFETADLKNAKALMHELA